MDGKWMTYTEAAVRLGVAPEAVREAHIATLKTDLERLTAELAGERAGRQGEVELLNGQLVTERERADRAIAELVELARRLAAIAETQPSAEPEPPRHWAIRAWRWMQKTA